MSERRPQALEGRQSSNRSNTGGDRDTSSNDDQPHPVQQHQHHARKKQFFVGGAHTRHHIRVPSYGRNLNKLSKLTPLATSPVNKGRGTDAEKPRPGKRLMFEVGEDNGSRAGSYKEGGDADGNTDGGAGAVTAAGGLVTSGAAPAKPSNGLAKSSSTKSLDRQLREGRRKSSRQGELSRRDRSGSRSRSRDTSTRPIPRQLSADNIVGMNSKRQLSQGELQRKVPSQLPQQPATPQPRAQHQSLAPLHTLPRLLPHTKPGAIPPQVNPESVTTVTKIQHAPPQNAPITPAHSLPNSDQHLTSRFADSPTGNPNSFSPSSATAAYTPSLPSQVGGSTTPTRPRETTTPPPLKPSTSNITSRTQQKLWLQWQSSQHESPQLAGQNHEKGPGSEWQKFQARGGREFERVNREYMNTRRFSNPVADSFERTLDKNPDKRIPQKRSGEAPGNMGLSQSLKETTAAKPFRRDGVTTRDDSGIQQPGLGRIEGVDDERVSGLEGLLLKLWGEGGDGVSSNE